MTTTTAAADQQLVGTSEDERRPLMGGREILMMNLGFFGVQFSFALTQSAVNPLFLLIGAEPISCRSSTWPDRSPDCSSSR
jgi:maltose/moltooligosaccharide transporter